MSNQSYMYGGLIVFWAVFLICFHVSATVVGSLAGPLLLVAAYLGWVNGNVFKPTFRLGTTLVVVDMQTNFISQLVSPQKTIFAVQLEIARARDLGQPILVVSFRGCGPVDERIMDALAGYGCWHRVRKSFEDGGSTVSDASMFWRCGSECFRLVGINSDACVYETAVSLSNSYPQSRIEVLVEACDTANDVGWSQYEEPEAGRVVLVDKDGNSVDPSTLPPPQTFLALLIGSGWPDAGRI
jgi:hypothetical protein